jgi:hypothetical protein
MLSIGGGAFSQGGLINQEQDPWPNGLGIFDMTMLSWAKAYDPDALAYERPSLVSQIYANNSRYPTIWGDPELESFFTSPNGTGGIVKDVVGGVVGGIAALVIIALIYWRLCRYKKREKRSQSPAELVTDECIAGQVTDRALEVGRVELC